jgi:L-lactate dehydrogenase complex protein LldG
MNQTRQEILGNIRSALGRTKGMPAPAVPPRARVSSRVPGDAHAELDLLLDEIGKLGGKTRRISNRNELQEAVEELVRSEQVKRATLWDTSELRELCIANTMTQLGVTIISPPANRWELETCDLGVTGADGALPETGTLLLRSSPEQPRLVSLLPRALLTILRLSALRADLHDALAGAKQSRQFVFVTGPSRTADIELTLTIGVHGPGALYVWYLEEQL